MSKDAVLNLRLNILKSDIMRFKINDPKLLEGIKKCIENEDYLKANSLIVAHLKLRYNFDRFIVKDYPQNYRNIIDKKEVRAGIELRSRDELNKLKIASATLMEKVRSSYGFNP